MNPYHQNNNLSWSPLVTVVHQNQWPWHIALSGSTVKL